MRYPESPLLKELTERIVQLYDESLFKGAVRPDAILFVEDTETEASVAKRVMGQAKIFEVKELHPALVERLGKDYMLIFYKLNAFSMGMEKLTAHLVEALMYIDLGGGLRQPDVKTFVPLARVLGPDWKQKQFAAADVMAGDLLKGIPLQATLDMSEVMQQAADAINKGALDTDGVKVTATVRKGA